MQKTKQIHQWAKKKKKKKASIEAGDIVPQALHKDTNSQLRKKKPENLLDTTSLHRNDNN